MKKKSLTFYKMIKPYQTITDRFWDLFFNSFIKVAEEEV